jgi:hypothetical protein
MRRCSGGNDGSWFPMASLPRKRLSPGQRQALKLLASDPQGATDELLVFIHEFDSNMIAGIVETGLAMAQLENMKAGGRAIEVVRIRITGAGRAALVAEDWFS